MGGGKKSKAPAAPNYEALQASDALANRETARELTRWNRPTQVDAWGNTLSWEEDANGNWTQRQSLAAPFNQGLNNSLAAYLNASSQAANQGGFNAPDNQWLSGVFNNAYANADFVNNAGAIGNFDRTQGDQVAKDMFESSMSRLRPEQARTQEALDVKLRQQGLQPGTEAYNRAMQNEMTSQGDVNAKLGLDATQAGYNTAMNIYNTNLAGQGQRYQQAADTFSMNKDQDWKALQGAMGLQDQVYKQALQNYTLPMERAQAAAQLYSQTPGANWQGFSGATGYNPADMTGAAQAGYQAKMGGYNSSQNKKGGLMNAGSSLGSSYLMSK